MVYRQAADPVAREVLYIPELAAIGSIPGANGRSAWRDQGSFSPPWKNDRGEDRFPRVGKTIGMQSEPGWPQIIMGTPLRKQRSERSVPTRGHVVKRAPQWCGVPAVDRRVAGDSSMRTGRTCMSTRSLFAPLGPAHAGLFLTDRTIRRYHGKQVIIL